MHDELGTTVPLLITVCRANMCLLSSGHCRRGPGACMTGAGSAERHSAAYLRHTACQLLLGGRHPLTPSHAC